MHHLDASTGLVGPHNHGKNYLGAKISNRIDLSALFTLHLLQLLLQRAHVGLSRRDVSLQTLARPLALVENLTVACALLPQHMDLLLGGMQLFSCCSQRRSFLRCVLLRLDKVRAKRGQVRRKRVTALL